jgi:hypothetical protein
MKAIGLLNDPDTDPALLAKIAYENEGLSVGVAKHPRAHVQLLRWLALFGDREAIEVALTRLEQMRQGFSNTGATYAGGTYTDAGAHYDTKQGAGSQTGGMYANTNTGTFPAVTGFPATGTFPAVTNHTATGTFPAVTGTFPAQQMHNIYGGGAGGAGAGGNSGAGMSMGTMYHQAQPQAAHPLQAQAARQAHNYTAIQALDPNTDFNTMRDMAARAPELREYLARNRNAYPELLQWLASLNDPAINRALKERA